MSRYCAPHLRLFFVLILSIGCGLSACSMFGRKVLLPCATPGEISEEFKDAQPLVDISKADAGRGRILFDQHCISCHPGTAVSPLYARVLKSPRLNCSSYLEQVSDGYLAGVIAHGGAFIDGDQTMVAWKETLSDSEIADLVKYLRSF